MCSRLGSREKAFKSQTKMFCKNPRCHHDGVMSSMTTTNVVGSAPVQCFFPYSGRLAARSRRPPGCPGAPARTALR